MKNWFKKKEDRNDVKRLYDAMTLFEKPLNALQERNRHHTTVKNFVGLYYKVLEFVQLVTDNPNLLYKNDSTKIFMVLEAATNLVNVLVSSKKESIEKIDKALVEQYELNIEKLKEATALLIAQIDGK